MHTMFTNFPKISLMKNSVKVLFIFPGKESLKAT